MLVFQLKIIRAHANTNRYSIETAKKTHNNNTANNALNTLSTNSSIIHLIHVYAHRTMRHISILPFVHISFRMEMQSGSRRADNDNEVCEENRETAIIAFLCFFFIKLIRCVVRIMKLFFLLLL